MEVVDSIKASPIETELSVRGDEIRGLTSCRAGKIVPHAFIPVLREDRVSRGQVTLDLEMAETVRPLLNSVMVTVMAHFIPFSAFDRFSGMDSFNKSYMKVKERAADAAVVPFFKTVAFDKTAAFWKTLGVQWPQGALINQAPLEAYNLLVNWLRAMRSATLPQRTLLDTTLAEAFWTHPFMWHVKPSFDQAMMDGEISFMLGNGKLPVSGIGFNTFSNPVVQSAVSVRDGAGGGTTSTYNKAVQSAGGSGYIRVQDGAVAADARAQVFAEMAGQSGKIRVSDIERAHQLVAWAKLREQYKGLSDEALKDLLMQGIRVPEENLRQPILLDKKSTIFGYTERHAMDGANLDQSVTTGKTRVTLNFRTPPMNTGGIILITSQIVPEQLFERLYDVFLGCDGPEDLPDFRRDFLDPEKVEVVKNKFVDVLHGTPEGTFGYAPLNHAWKRSITRIGGKFYRPVPDTFVEDRQRFWSVEQLNPALNTDFYLVNGSLPHSVFADTLADPFEVTTLGGVQIVGNTVFGETFDEDTNDYEKVQEGVENSPVVQA